MPRSSEQRRAGISDEVDRLAGERLGKAEAETVRRLAALYLHGMPPEDLAEAGAENLFGAIVGLYRFGAKRPEGAAKVRAFNPSLDEHGWHSHHSVVEIVNDDMPFLVDSVTAAINGTGRLVHLVVHPILAVERDAAGRIAAVDRPADQRQRAESWMHIHVEELADPAALRRLEERVLEVLADVRAAVGDWRAMRDRIADAIAALKASPPPVSAEEAAETIALLDWMAEDHFTFLGYRDYAFETTDEGIDLKVLPDSGLGILRDPAVSVFEGTRQFAHLPQEIQEFIQEPNLIVIAKANLRATVHRPVPLDAVIVKRFDEAGRVAGERLFAGLFTSTAYSQSARAIPYLRRKVRRALAAASFDPRSHDGKALTNILDTFPRDELFQIDEQTLLDTAMGILHLQDRQRTALFTRRDPFGRFVSALVYVPRDRFDTALRRRIQALLEQAFDGRVSDFFSQLTEGVHARVQYIVQLDPRTRREPDAAELEAQVAEMAKTWGDRLKYALIEALGEGRGVELAEAYAEAFPLAYQEHTAAERAVGDVERLEQVDAARDINLNLYREPEAAEHEVHFKLFHRGSPVPLSDILPMLEHMGLRVISEVPHEVRAKGRDPVWIHDFRAESEGGHPIDIGAVRQTFHEAFAQVWAGALEDDGLNRLVLTAGLTAREVTILRACTHYLRQAGLPYSQTAVQETLGAYPRAARLLVDLVLLTFDPDEVEDRDGRIEAVRGELAALLEAIQSLEQDWILRRLTNLVDCMLRTNLFQRGPDGEPKPYLSFKLDSTAILDLPPPRPHCEIFVYSPRVEAVHLRGGRVARGGIRWSDRREDFRTEVLGLMKAQMVKNAVIVPVGSKGGFVVKRPPAEGGREALQAEGVECYRIMMRGLLDLTDNLVDGQAVQPPRLRRLDGDDPYLVVAADKGTATFSDIANAISADYGFWLGDAFASGGSAGYDHKAMGITARGAWEAVKRHFREDGLDTQSQDFDVVGVGDMSGDVFGNGMLLSRHIRLVAAFNHLHVFVDPAPDPTKSFEERQRLFGLGRGSWDQYDREKLSPGGGVFDRRAKSVTLSPEIRERLDIGPERVSPAELIRAILRARADLLWFGGIGTFVKAPHESHADVGDKANDSLRVDAGEIRARVVAEGANLGVTQAARIAAARAGVRLNTDFIDNSAGVDCSDHEVNIKVLLNQVVAAGDLTLKQRNALLEEMTDDVARLVLRDNYLQTQAITLVEAEAPQLLERQSRLMRQLEREGRLDRALEGLPDDDELTERLGRRRGLTRPEIAVLLAYSKIALYGQLLDSPLPDDESLQEEILRYFPPALHERFAGAIPKHRLAREIIATAATNSLVNRTGPTFVSEMVDRTGMGPPDVARAFIVVRDTCRLRALWAEIEALDAKVPAEVQTLMMLAIGHMIERGTSWVLRNCAEDLAIGALVARFRPGFDLLIDRMDDVLYDKAAQVVSERARMMVRDGVPAELARRVASLNILAAGFDLVEIADRTSQDAEAVAPIYFEVGVRLGLAWLRDRAGRSAAGTRWEEQATSAIVDDLYALQAELAVRVIEFARGQGDVAVDRTAIDAWIARRASAVERIEALIAEFRALDRVDVSMLAVANRRLRSLLAG